MTKHSTFQICYIIYLMEAHTNFTFITSFKFCMSLSLSLARAIQIYFVVLWHLLSFFSNRMSNAKRLLCLIFGSFCNVSRSRREQRLIYGRKEEKLLRLSCAFFFFIRLYTGILLGKWKRSKTKKKNCTRTRTPMGAILSLANR